MKKTLAVCLALTLGAGWRAVAQPTQNVVLITLDGVRWQEVFAGADAALLADEKATPDPDKARREFWAPTPQERREKLLPFIWKMATQQGQLLGNRTLGSRVNVSNPHWFSYPGYNELLAGYADDRINSNEKKPNPNTTVLEFLNRQAPLRGKVAVFSSWDVIEAAVNEDRSGIPANAANEPHGAPTAVDSLLNDMTALLPRPWGDGVRADFLTYFRAKTYLTRHRPRVVFLSFDETDELGHAGRYYDHLVMLQSLDRYLADLWRTLQALPDYAGKTTFILTTDHGRGITNRGWRSHGTGTAKSYEMWLAAWGPGIAATGEQAAGPVLFQNQVAATLARLLGYDFRGDQPAGAPIETLLTTKP